MSLLLKNTIQASIINYVGVIIAFSTVLFIQTQILSEEEIGIIRLLADKSLIFVHFFMFGMQSVASRFYFYFEDDKKEYSSFMTLILGFPIVMLSLGLILVTIFQINLVVVNFNYIALILCFYIYIQILESYLSTKQKIVVPSFLRDILFRVFFIVGLLLYFYRFIDFEQLLIFYVGIYFTHFFLLLIYFRKNLTFNFNIDLTNFNRPIFKEIAKYSFFLILGAGSVTLISKIDTIMIEGITNSQAFVGIYAIAFSISNIIDVVKRPIVKLSLPIIAKNLKENKLAKVLSIYRKSSINLMIAGSFMFTLLWLNIDLIFSIIPNSDIYQAGKYVVFFLALAKLFDLSLGVNYEIIQSSIYYKWNILLTPFLAVLSIVLNIYFITKYSFLGAAIATAISILTYNILRTVLVLVKLKLHPFTANYLKVILLIFIPFFINYFVSIENLIFNLCWNVLVLFLTFILPIYLLKLSDEFNYLIDAVLVKLRIIKIKKD
jgi:O-antigen/teichoic acid export membrane protein